MASAASPAPPPTVAPTSSGFEPAIGISGTPTLSSAYVVGNGTVLVFVGSESWTAIWTSDANGSEVYSNALILIAFDISTADQLLRVDAYQGSHGWVSNQSILLAPLVQTTITVNAVSDPSWRAFNVYMDGVEFTCQIATPISLIPPSVLNVGGLDILALGIISESIACFAGMVALAKVLMRRAKWAPKFSLIVWGHVVLIGILAAVIVDYQFVDQTFAGWSPLVYAFAVSPMMFLFSLSLFNSSEKVELLQRIAKPHGHILYRRWLLRCAVLPSGALVLIDERWRGWLARIFGHHVTVEKGDEFEAVKFEGEVENRLSPTHSKGVDKLSDRFKVANPQEDEVSRIWWTDTGDPIKVVWPHLTIHRLKHVEAKLSPEGAVLVAAHDKMGLSLPHYTESEVELHRALEDYKVVEALSAGWANARDLARVLSKVKTDLYALKAGFSAQVEAEKEAALVAYYSLIGRTNVDLSDEEAENAAKKGSTAPSLAELLDEVRLRPPAVQAKPKKGSP